MRATRAGDEPVEVHDARATEAEGGDDRREHLPVPVRRNTCASRMLTQRTCRREHAWVDIKEQFKASKAFKVRVHLGQQDIRLL